MNSVKIPGGFRGNPGFSGNLGVWGAFGRFGASKGFCANSNYPDPPFFLAFFDFFFFFFFVFRFSLLFCAFFLSFPRILGVPRREKPLLFWGKKNPCLFSPKKSKDWRVRVAFIAAFEDQVWAERSRLSRSPACQREEHHQLPRQHANDLRRSPTSANPKAKGFRVVN